MNGQTTPRIGYVLKMFPRLSETFILNEILELERQSVSLHIFSLKRPVEEVVHGEAKLVRAPITYLPESIAREPFRIARAHLALLWRYPRSYVRALRHVLRGREMGSLGRGLRRFSQTCCLVHEMGPVRHLHAHFATDPTRLACWAQIICRVPYSVTTHAKDLYQAERIGSPGLRLKLSRAKFVATNSEHTANALRTGSPHPARVHTIYNGVNLAAFPRRQQEPTEPLILSVGRLVEKKGFTDLLQACRLLKDWGVRFRCEIIGTGALEALLRKLIGELHLQQEVKMLGSMAQRKLLGHYERAMVFALPCVVAADGDRDVLPNVLKEAMGVGVPVVTTDLPAIEELITHGSSGLLVPPGEPRALAGTLERVLCEPELRQRLSTHGRRVIEERFEVGANFARLKHLLLAALEEASAEPGTLERTTPSDPVAAAEGAAEQT